MSRIATVESSDETLQGGAATPEVQTFDPRHFHAQAHDALGDAQIRGNFRNAMDGLMRKRRDAFADWGPIFAPGRWPGCRICSNSSNATVRPMGSRSTGPRMATKPAGSFGRSASHVVPGG